MMTSIEPLYIMYGDAEWGHPSTREFVGDDFDVDVDYHSNLFKWVLDLDGKRVYVITTSSDESYGKMMSIIQGDIEDDGCFGIGFVMIEEALFGDCWVVGGEQFSTTEFGQSLHYPKKLDLISVSPDVCLHVDDKSGLFNGFST